MASVFSHHCPRCTCAIFWGDATGVSGIYGSDDVDDLCEACFLEEDEQIDREGTNDLPQTLARYRQNMRDFP